MLNLYLKKVNSNLFFLRKINTIKLTACSSLLLITLSSCGTIDSKTSEVAIKKQSLSTTKEQSQSATQVIQNASHKETDTWKIKTTATKKYKSFTLINDDRTENDISHHMDKPISLKQHGKTIWQEITANFHFCGEHQDDSTVVHFIHKILASPKTYNIMTINSAPYISFIHEEIKKRNMPPELALLPIVESGYLPTAESHRGAAGLWQFTRGTGKYYGLKQNWWYDARLDVYQSTIAALNFLQDLHYTYKSWPITLAAYNYGAGNINRLIKRNKRKNLSTDYWSLNLPKETRQYVPKLIAYCHLLENAEKYRLKTHQSIPKSPLISVETSKIASIKELAKAANISIKKFKQLNPGFLRWVPNPKSQYAIFIPQSNHAIFKQNIKKITPNIQRLSRYKVQPGDTMSDIAKFHSIKLGALLGANKIRKNGIIRPGDQLLIPYYDLDKRQPQGKRRGKNTHLVKAGDTLYYLARKYKIKIKNLMSANKLRKSTIIRPGDLLTIPR